MKVTEYWLSLPLAELVNKLDYEIRWGVIRGTLISEIELSPQAFVLIAQDRSDLTTIILTADELHRYTVLHIAEPENHNWNQLLGELFLSFRIPPHPDKSQG